MDVGCGTSCGTGVFDRVAPRFYRWKESIGQSQSAALRAGTGSRPGPTRSVEAIKAYEKSPVRHGVVRTFRLVGAVEEQRRTARAVRGGADP